MNTRAGKFSISGLISGNNDHARQERLAKLEIEIREFKGLPEFKTSSEIYLYLKNELQ